MKKENTFPKISITANFLLNNRDNIDQKQIGNNEKSNPKLDKLTLKRKNGQINYLLHISCIYHTIIHK